MTKHCLCPVVLLEETLDGGDTSRGHEQVTGVAHAEISAAARCFLSSNEAFGGAGHCLSLVENL